MDKIIVIKSDQISKRIFPLSIKNHTFCLIDGKILLLPNSAIRIISLVYEYLVFNKMPENYLNFELGIIEIAPIGPSNFLAIRKGVEFLLNFKRNWTPLSDDPIARSRCCIFNKCSITNEKLIFQLCPEFSLKIKSNNDAGIPLINSNVSIRAASAQFPLELNI